MVEKKHSPGVDVPHQGRRPHRHGVRCLHLPGFVFLHGRDSRFDVDLRPYARGCVAAPSGDREGIDLQDQCPGFDRVGLRICTGHRSAARRHLCLHCQLDRVFARVVDHAGPPGCPALDVRLAVHDWRIDGSGAI